MANKHRKVWKVVSGNHFPENKHSQKEKHFPGNQTKFFFDWKVFSVNRKVFPLTNFSNNKQTQKNLENNFSKSKFQKTNMS
jgi:hypothetical protein